MRPTQGVWSLHRKGPADQARHRQKVLEAIRDNLAEIVSDEAIITSEGDRIVKVPLPGLKEWRFRFDPRSHDHVGHGTGKELPGDVLAQDASPGSGSGGGGRGQAGRNPGTDYYEAEVSVDELADIMFADLGLPKLTPRPGHGVSTQRLRFDYVRKSGPLGRLDVRRTLRSNLARRARQGNAVLGELADEDLRYRTWRIENRKQVNAAVIAMRDVSASMGEFKKYLTRSFCFWMVRFLRTQFDAVQIVFITHHTEAKEVSEQAFFTLGESGGTRVSSAYRLALQVIEQRFHPTHWNLYPIHFSDGDNWGEQDNADCVQLVRKLLQHCNVFGYGEISERGYVSPLLRAFRQLEHEAGFITLRMHRRQDVYPALKRYFRPTGHDV